MKVSVVLREALIADLVKCCYSKGLQITVNSVNKLIYLIQTLYSDEVPIIYDYYLYEKDGPINFALRADLTKSFMLNNIIIKCSGEIEPSSNTLNAIKQGWAFLEKVRPYVDEVLNRFGEITEKELNNLSSIVYINKHIDEFITEDIDRDVFI